MVTLALWFLGRGGRAGMETGTGNLLGHENSRQGSRTTVLTVRPKDADGLGASLKVRTAEIDDME